MNDEILERLASLEGERGIKILYACESGSRAWGFPSPDSDYDVRFLYTHPRDWYLTLSEGKDTIDLPIDANELDIGGWELRKALKLLWKSNAAILEWIQSPIVYREEPGFLEDITRVGESCFSPIAVMFHWLNMSKSFYETCQENEAVKLKKYFYALRTATAGKWISEKKGMSPIVFPEMLDLIPEPARQRVIELMEIKSKQDESYMHVQEPILNSYLEETIPANEVAAKSLSAGNGKIEDLDEVFRKWIS